MCVATALFKGGVIRDRIDIQGITSVLKRNILNDCEYYKYKLFSTKLIRDLKAWALRSIYAEETGVKDYSIKAEKDGIDEYLRKEHEQDNPETYETVSEDREAYEEDAGEIVCGNEDEDDESYIEDDGCESVGRGTETCDDVRSGLDADGDNTGEDGI